MAELTPFSIRNFTKGLNRRADQQDIGMDLFRDIRNMHQDEWGKLVSLAGNVASTTNSLVGEILAMAVFYPSASGLEPHLIIMTDGNSTQVTSPIGSYGAEGRIYRSDLLLTTFTEIATGVTFSWDAIFPCRNRLVTMNQIDNKLFIATGYGPVRIWNGTNFITEAGLNAPVNAPTVIAVNGPGDTSPGASFTVRSSLFGVIPEPRHFTVIRGRENEFYCAIKGVGMTEFVRVNRDTGVRTSLGALPVVVQDNRYALVGHSASNSVTLVVNNSGSDKFIFHRYDRDTNSWNAPVERTVSQMFRISAAIIHSNSSGDLFVIGYNTSYLPFIYKFSSDAAYTYQSSFQISGNPHAWGQSGGGGVPPGDYRIMATCSDRTGDSFIYFLQNESGTGYSDVGFRIYNITTNALVNFTPQRRINAYQMSVDDALVYVNGSMESRIHLIKGGVGMTLADSLYKSIDNPGLTDWQVMGGTYIGRFASPCIAPGGLFRGDSGNKDFAVYGNQMDGSLVKNFFMMQPTQKVNDTVLRRYKYGYTFANDQTESALSPESAEITVVSGRPVRVTFDVSTQSEVSYRRLYRTDDYYGIGTAPPVAKRLQTDRNAPVDKWRVNDNTSTFFVDDSDQAGVASGRATQPDGDLQNVPPPAPSTSPPPHNASIVTVSGGRMFLAGFPFDISIPTNPSMVAFSTVDDYETFDPVGGVINLDRSDGDSITAMIPLDQDSLAIYKVNSIHVKHGDPTYAGAFRRVSDTIGCIAPRSAVSAGHIHCFLSKLGVYDFDGSTPRPMSEAINLDMERNLDDAQKILAAGVFHDNKYHIAIVDPEVSTTKNSVVYVWDFPLQVWTARNIEYVRFFTDVRGTIKRLLFAPYNDGETAGRIMRWNSGGHLVAVACRVETGFFDMGNSWVDKIWRRFWFQMNIPDGLEVTVDWSVDDGRATGTLDPIVGTGKKEQYLIQCPRSMMGKNLKLVINYEGIGMFEIYGIDGQAIVMSRRRGI